MFRIAWRYLVSDKIRTLFTSVGIILSVSLIIIIGVLNLSMYKTFKHIYTESGGSTDIVVKKNNGFSEKDIEFINNIEGVQAIAPMCALNVKVYQNGIKQKVWTKGVSVDKDREMRNYSFIDGNWFTSENSREIIINEESARKLQIKYNDNVKLSTRAGTYSYKVVGIIENKGAGSSNELEMYTPLLAITGDSGFEGWHYALDINVEKDEQINDIAYIIQNEYGKIVTTKTLTEHLKVARKSLNNINMGFYVILIIVILSGMLFIYDTFIINLYERINNIGMLKAIGMNKRQMMKVFLWEGFLLGIFGSLTGAILGIFASMAILNVIKNMVYSNLKSFDISPGIFFLSIAIGFVISIVSCMIPAIKASNYSPVAALRHTEDYYESNKKKNKTLIYRIKFIMGIIMILLSFFYFNIIEQYITSDSPIRNFLLPIAYLLIFISFMLLNPMIMEKFLYIIKLISQKLLKREIILSTRNLARNSNRTNVIISFIVISIAISIGFNGMFNSLKQSMDYQMNKSVNCDILINTTWNLSVQDYEDKYTMLESLPDVKWLYYNRIEYFKDDDNESNTMIGVDSEKYKELGDTEILDGSLDDFYNDENVVLVGKYYIQNLGYKIGDSILLPGKSEDHEFLIAGIVNDFLYNGKVTYLHRDKLDNMMGNKLCNNIYIKSSNASNINDLINKIDSQIIKNDSSTITSSNDYIDNLRNEVSSSSWIFDIINILVLVIAVLGLANAILISILKRKDEISMLRSMGATQKFIQKMIFNESIITIVYGIIMGTILGIILAWRTKAIMEKVNYISLSFHVPFNFLCYIIIIVFICSIAATIYPASKASKTPIVDS